MVVYYCKPLRSNGRQHDNIYTLTYRFLNAIYIDGQLTWRYVYNDNII